MSCALSESVKWLEERGWEVAAGSVAVVIVSHSASMSTGPCPHSQQGAADLAGSNQAVTVTGRPL